MKRELTPVQRQWVEALRSGKYEQVKGRLRRKDKFCCLGVACDRYAKETGREWGPPTITDSLTFLGQLTVLPADVKAWLGLRTDNGSFDGTALSIENDQGKTFSQIADLIEQHADELFVEAQP